MSRIQSLYTDSVRERWREIEPFIERALEYSLGTLAKEQVLEALTSGEMQGFLVCTPNLVGVCVTRIQIYPATKNLEVLLLAGDGFDEWGGELDGVLRRLGGLTQCNRMVCMGRRGWARKLRQLGWGEQSVLVAKEL